MPSPSASGRHLHGALVVFVSLLTSQSGSSGTCVKHRACQVARCVWSLGLFCENMKIGCLFFETHPRFIKCFLFWLNHLTAGSTTTCVSRKFMRGLLRKVDSGTFCDWSRGDWNTWEMQSVARCLAWVFQPFTSDCVFS